MDFVTSQRVHENIKPGPRSPQAGVLRVRSKRKPKNTKKAIGFAENVICVSFYRVSCVPWDLKI